MPVLKEISIKPENNIKPINRVTTEITIPKVVESSPSSSEEINESANNSLLKSDLSNKNKTSDNINSFIQKQKAAPSKIEEKPKEEEKDPKRPISRVRGTTLEDNGDISKQIKKPYILAPILAPKIDEKQAKPKEIKVEVPPVQPPLQPTQPPIASKNRRQWGQRSKNTIDENPKSSVFDLSDAKMSNQDEKQSPKGKFYFITLQDYYQRCK